MLIVVDTNVLAPTANKELVPLLELTEYARYANALVAIPEVVETEFFAYLEREFSDAEQKMANIVRRLPESVAQSISFDRFSKAAKAATRRLKSKLAELVRQKRVQRIPISKVHARLAVKRATNRRPPCSQSGEEVRDAMIWEASLSVLQHWHGPLVLLSADKHFRDEVLEQEVEELGTGLSVFDSIDGFLKAMRVSQDQLPRSAMETISKDAKFLASLTIHVAADPYGGWQGMISNFVEGGVLDLIAGEFSVESIQEISVGEGLRRPLGKGKYSVHLPFEAVVCVKCEAFQWVEHPPEQRNMSEASEKVGDQKSALESLLSKLPKRVPAGDPEVVELDFGIRGEAVFIGTQNSLNPDAVGVHADPFDAGFRGQPRTSQLIFGPSPW